MKQGKIIKAQKELYYVDCNGKILMAKARGNFRVKKIKPLVGDNVVIDDLEDRKAYITEILPRKNEIKRPNISNIDQILLFATIKDPILNLYNLDKYLAMCEYKDMDVVIVLSKIDLCDENEVKDFENIYENIGYKLISLDNFDNFPKEKILDILKNKTSAVSGASGVGKSTFLNNLIDIEVETGSISEKSKRGKNTTRHTEIFKIGDESFLFDTPGFDSFDIDFIEDEKELKYLFREFRDKRCKFKDCNHINEPACGVKSYLADGLISKSRYDNYLMLFEEVKKRRENKW
ncbi:Putative ribosome biogenesis GTPase RsgA [Anaerococcus prevotii]|uniref:Small ribosomal subunit biogenesis GTPase RsgA n=1 Tax=Anaerococcus prevotii (strain ATCC 9321 / DSM 20548 / JCM 6508 / NCTC 11806 / PC1) TaxID=525919 RepID=C7RGU6_ANAPD|nr:ribosome small subunit-dependent GTPase A [Anaerococcus prevotii]ACV28707.1 ribosome small subunit-dependent GTPase A [Anaerococcus prevotii DSM 20548]SUU94270.1 Putative ribosome biogenesis GTPase RsgA [Anaerococcus prevotii]